MNVHTFKRQLIRDLQASWQKTAVLAVLLCIGAAMWGTQLIKLFTGGGKSSSAAAVNVVKTSTSLAESLQLMQAASPPSDARAKSGLSWQVAEQRLATDPLVRSADPAALEGNPFRMDLDQFPPPVLFADESTRIAPPKVAAAKPEPITRPNLELRSIAYSQSSPSRSSAFINSKTYFPGDEIHIGPRTFTLAAIEPTKVVLEHQGQVFELEIAPPKIDGIEIEKSLPNFSIGIQ